jgi:tRNA pseudouridine38-40 synthase
MANWKLTLSYDGTGFHGWQVQPGLVTVQGVLAKAIQQVSGESVLPQGSGRTDAGVHALAQVASFSLEAGIPAGNLQRALNRALPPSVRVLAAEAVAEGFHARHSAVRKSYEYRIFTGAICPPFVAPYVWDCHWPLALEPMQQAAAALCGRHDFRSFAATDPELSGQAPNPVKTIFCSEVTREDEGVVYRVTGSGFLHHMVRNVVGTLVEMGRGAVQAREMATILEAKDRSAAGPTAPPQGLFLVSVAYEPALSEPVQP